MSHITHIHDRYRHAVEAARDERLPDDARERATDALVDARHDLDEALILAVEPNGVRMDDPRYLRALSARGAAGPSDAELREWLDPNHPTKSVRLSLGDAEARAFEWYKDTAGDAKLGYSVPTTVMDRIVYHVNAESGVFGPAYKLLTATGEDITVPVLTTDAAATLTAETVAATPGQAVFGSETLDAYRIDITFPISNELLRDSAVDIKRVVGDAAGRAIATKLAAYLATGTGSGEPEGITVGGTSALTAGNATTFTFDEVKQLFYSVLPGARRNGVFVGGSSATLLLAQMKDLNDSYIWQPSNIPGAPEMLLGKPYYEDAAMPACTAGLKPLAFGDLGNYFWIRLVDRENSGGIELSFSEHYEFTKNMTWARAAMWVDSRVMGTGGEIKYITLAA